MGLNKKFVKMKNDRRAEMGVGTMIIFIAMVLVAAVAASVLISTANNVREQAAQTGNDAINEVASGFNHKYTNGKVDANNKITELYVYIQLHAGSPAISLDNVVLSIATGGDSGELTYDATGGAQSGNETVPATYGAILVPPAEDGSSFLKYGTVAQGDLVKITIKNIGAANLAISAGDTVSIKIVPKNGAATTISFTAPYVLNDSDIVSLR